MQKLFLLLFLLPLSLFSQSNICIVANSEDSIIHSTFSLIKKTAPYHYVIFEDAVQEVQFWNEDYPTNNLIEGRGVVVIPIKDLKLNSINTVAATLVHESYHLKVFKYGPDIAGREEEYLCYVHELKFLKLLPNVELDLLAYTKEQVELWNIK